MMGLQIRSRRSGGVEAAVLVIVLCGAGVGAFTPSLGAPRGLGGRLPVGISARARPVVGLLETKGEVAVGLDDSAMWTRPASKGKRDVIIGTKINTMVPVAVTSHDEGCSLGAYMSLPPEQYVLIPLPNKAKLERIDGGNFRLKVPPCSSTFPTPAQTDTAKEAICKAV